MEKSILDMFVLDPGAHSFRAGRAEDFPLVSHSPYVVLPMAVRPSDDADSTMTEPLKAGVTKSSVATQIFGSDGRIHNWDGLEVLLHYIFYKQLGWPQGDEGYAIFTEDPTRMSRDDRERLALTLFESFNVRGTYFLDSAVASVYAAGKITGMAVDVGHSGATVAQVVDGTTVIGSAQRLPLGAAQLDTLVREQLRNLDVGTRSSNIATIREQNACVADSREEFERLDMPPTAYTLPDGQTISVTSEWYALGEALFYPWRHMPSTVIDRTIHRHLGLAEAAFCSAMVGTDAAQRQALLSNIVLSGGCSKIPRLHQRFMREIRSLMPSSSQISMLKIPDYLPEQSTHYAGYIGAAIVGKSLNASHTMTKEDYDEHGPAYIHKKC